MDDLPIPEDELPEPVRKMIEMARASGGRVRMLPIGALGEAGPKVLEIGGLSGNPDAPKCDCHWCTLDRKLQAVNATTKLSVNDKYEAAIELLRESAAESESNGDAPEAFSKRIQAAAWEANQANRAWLLGVIEERIGVVVREVLAELGIEAPPDTVGAIRAVRDRMAGRGSDSPEQATKTTTQTLVMTDLVKLRSTLLTDAPEFHVNPETDPKRLAKEV